MFNTCYSILVTYKSYGLQASSQQEVLKSVFVIEMVFLTILTLVSKLTACLAKNEYFHTISENFDQ